MDNNFNDFNGGNNFDNSNLSYGNNQGGNEFNGGNFDYTPQQPQKDPGHGLAIASLVLGIISLLSCCCVYLSVIVGVVGVVLAIISKNKSNTGKMETMALAGMILSIVGIVLAVGYIIFGLVAMQSPEYQDIYQQMMNSYEY